MLTLNLLGSPQILWQGKPVSKLTSAKSQALLFFLALSPRPHTRLELGGLLWPEKSDDEARTNLRQSVMLVRKPISKAIFDTQRESIQFNSDQPISVDVSFFTSRVEGFLKYGDLDNSIESHLDELLAAADAYHGPFLDGFFVEDANPFEEWMLAERGRLHQMAIDLFSRLVDYFTARRETTRGLLYARRLVTLEPLREESYQQLMRLLAWDGDIGGALAQYKACKEMLYREFDLSPSPETELLYQRLQRLRTLGPPALPTGYTPIVNRVRELADLSQILHHPQKRLVTLMGLGGVGKSRTALAVAERQQHYFLDGVYWIDLADAEMAEDIIYAIAGEVECRFSGSASPAKQLIQFLRRREMLLVLDNFEQLMRERESARLVAQLLRGTSDLKLLITSRVRLNLREEQIYRLHHFDVTHVSSLLSAQNHAVQLFAQGAQQIRPDWSPLPEIESVTRICQLVEGLPLGLEMAAALTESQSCIAIANALESGIGELELESLDMPERHQSLRATFNYSFHLLEPNDQSLLVNLSIFRATFSAQAAEAIVGASIKDLGRLISRSLVRFEPPARYAVHNTIRELAAELSEGENGTIRQRFRSYYLTRLADQDEALGSLDAKPATRLLTTAYENIRHAWLEAKRHGDDDLTLKAAQSLETYLGLRGLYLEGVKLFGEDSQSTLRPETVAQLKVRQAHFLVRLARYDELITNMERVTTQFPHDQWIQTKGRAFWSEGLWRQGRNHRQAQEIALAGLEVAKQDQLGEPLAHAFFNLGVISDLSGQHETAFDYFNSALEAYIQVGNTRKVALVKNSMGVTAYNQGDLEQAREFLDSTLDMYQQMGDIDGELLVSNNIGIILKEGRSYPAALDYFNRVTEIAFDAGQQSSYGKSLLNIGDVYLTQGDYQQSLPYLKNALAVFVEIKEMSSIVTVRNYLSRNEAFLNNHDASKIHFEEAVTICSQYNLEFELANTYLMRADLLITSGQNEDGRKMALQAAPIAEKIGSTSLLEKVNAFIK